MLRPFWSKLFQFDWKFGTALILAVCIPRFILVLDASESGNYGPISWIMIFSALIPFIFLSGSGRKMIGLSKPSGIRWVTFSVISGVFLGTMLYGLGVALYDETVRNWYVYIGRSYSLPAGISGQDKLIYFLIYALTGMIFSPVGEEFFFRGVVHTSLAKSFGETRASLLDASAFALTHLSHFGVIYVSGNWTVLPLPGILWMAGMFVSSLIFYYCRKKSGSILGAVLSHAAFNLTMIFFIFYGFE